MAIRIADNKGASKRFGFGGAPDDPITSSPKYADQWFIEFTDTSDTTKDISAQAQSVSPITIQTTTQSVDRYGRREHIPVRVDFPEVTVTLYDTVDGKTMVFAKEIYSQFFKNSDLSVGAGVSTIEDINSGRKLPTSVGTESHKNFDKVTVYHFFGSFQGGKGNGTIQRIVLINPVVTSITFSESDYSQSGLRTISITLQPENVIFGTPTNSPAAPTWIRDGERLNQESFDVGNTQTTTERLENDLGVKNLSEQQGRDLTSRPSGQTLNSEKRRAMNADEKQRLRELQRARRALDATNADPNATQEEKDAALQRFQDAKANSPIVSVNPETKLRVENESASTLPTKDTSLSSQKSRASDINNQNMKAPPAPQVPSTETVPNVGDTRTYNETYSGRNIGGEPYVPGKPMSATQIAAIDASLAMGNATPPDSVMADYNSGREVQRKKAEAAQRDLDNPGVRGRMTDEERAEAEKKAKQNNINNLKNQRGPQ
jgi:hypothetical protein